MHARTHTHSERNKGYIIIIIIVLTAVFLCFEVNGLKLVKPLFEDFHSFVSII